MPLSPSERGASERSEIAGYAHGDALGYPLAGEMSEGQGGIPLP